MPRKPARPPEPVRTALGPGDWVQAALKSIAGDGLAAVSVEGLARALGVTKGSFYWHFSSREDLLREALATWEQAMGLDVAVRFKGIADPRERLRILMFAAFEDRDNGLLFAALAATSSDPLVQPVLQRVSERRMALGMGSLRALGFDEEEARRRAIFLYSAYAGYFSLQRAAPGAIGEVDQLSTYVKYLVDALLPPLDFPQQGEAGTE
jgi:AcrR family transcriptional regulator